ncbi:MAG: DMT family transporter [Hyphomicrobium sp.]
MPKDFAIDPAVIGNRFAILVVAAALCFTIGGIFMKQADGVRHLVPTLTFMAWFVLGASLQAIAMRGTDLSVTYNVVVGIEAILALSFGVALFGESLTAAKAVSTALIVAGIMGLRST